MKSEGLAAPIPSIPSHRHLRITLSNLATYLSLLSNLLPVSISCYHRSSLLHRDVAKGLISYGVGIGDESLVNWRKICELIQSEGFGISLSFYAQLFKTSLFKICSRYMYTLAHFQQNVFSKKLNKLFPNGH